MEKLKQHGFLIAVGATGLVLISLMIFLVFQPIGHLADARSRLEAKIKQVNDLSKRKDPLSKEIQPYTKKYEAFLDKKKAAFEEAREKGVEAYVALSRSFTLFFDDQETPPPLSEFSARYKDELDKLIKDYRDKFNIKPDPALVPGQEADKDPTPPRIDRVTEQLDSEEKVPLVMREFWFTQEIFKACTHLELGGLKQIEFKGRFDSRKEAQPYHALLEGTVQVELPPSRLEDFVTAIFSSERVLFRVEELTFRRTPEGIVKMAPIEHSKPFKDALEAQKVSYKDVLSEPPVLLDLRLSAFEFTRVPPEAESSAEAVPGAPPKKPGKS